MNVKKQYMSPSISVIAMNIENCIMAGSGEGSLDILKSGDSETLNNSDDILSKPTYSVWDLDEE